MKLFRKNKRRIACFFVLNFLIEILSPLQSFALTGGPSQPEVEGFQPIGMSDMVNTFSGDFSYNIPLIDVDGYPINIAYNSGVTNDEEASWVGLGWNINPGVINRNMRGIPDEFDGDPVEKEFNMKANTTIGAKLSVGSEIFGFDPQTDAFTVTASLGINYNNYNGYGIETGINPSLSASGPGKTEMTIGLGLQSGSGGLSISPSISFDQKTKETQRTDEVTSRGISIGSSFNSRSGMSGLSLSTSVKRNSGRKNKSGADDNNGFSAGGGISFGITSYTPTINMPMKNYSFTASYKMGGEITGFFKNATISAYGSTQMLNLDKGKKIVKAYGYNNSQNADEENTMMDFNRDWDVSYSKNTPMLPQTNMTYDILSVSGQGISGSFRPFRNDFGYVKDNVEENRSTGGSLGLELGFGNIFKGGLDINVNNTNTKSGGWYNQNLYAQNLTFKSVGNDAAFEPYSYKQMGEMNVDDEPALFNTIGGNSAVKVKLNSGDGFDVLAKNTLATNSGSSTNVSPELYRKKRIKRNQVLNVVPYSDLYSTGLHSNDDPIYHAPGHHAGEISVLKSDGGRYIYGIPAYNTYQEEVTFSVGMTTDNKSSAFRDKSSHHKNYDPYTGYYDYIKGDNSVNNNRGKDHYYSSTKMPAFAHSYLLTSVLSADYVDIDNIKGPSKDDIGNYTVFKYKKLLDKYKWRTPYDPYGQSANFSEGLLSNSFDDKANYVYGEKEIWYLDKIETKNTVAIFTLEDRKDGYEVSGRDGGRDAYCKSTKLLRKISLYSKTDYEQNGAGAIPIKEVHFEYDYSLCPGVYNNSGIQEMVMIPGISGPVNLNENKGKLTLKKIYFTYGTSYKSKFSPYEFTYSVNSLDNPSYGPKNMDRWGNYKPTQGNILNSASPISPNSEFPYVLQNKDSADIYTSAWQLKEIKMPSGGKIVIETESDDYAYVQNKKAMEMFKVVHFGWNQTSAENLSLINNKLMQPSVPGIPNINFLYMVIKLPVAVNDDNDFYNKYLEGINDNLYFKFLIDVVGNNFFNKDYYEFISGYTSIDGYHIFSYGGENYAWIKLKEVDQGDASISDDVNPISKAAWQFARLNMPTEALSRELPEDYGLVSFINKIKNAGFVSNIIQTMKGPNGTLNGFEAGKKVNLGRSFIRLLSPKQKKLGGGLRVKKITMSDEWNTMTGNNSATYGQEYEYTTTDPETGDIISSGVAAFEPQIGSDENPFSLPIYYGDKDENLLAPGQSNFLTGPVGNNFYPSASIGYSRVKVKNLSNSDINRHATGYTVSEFYTAKDFPVITEATTIDAEKRKTNPVLSILKLYNRDYMTVSQGYSIELNDMHGKEKASWVYAEDSDKPISGVEYKYQTSTFDKHSLRLENIVPVIYSNGSYNNREIGVEYEFFTDFREQSTSSIAGGINTNLSTFLAAIFPGVVPFACPSYSQEETRFRSAVAMKIIYRYGVLKETIAHDLGSAVSTQNLAYDSETGLVLLTKTKNNFEDEIYSFNYPAHWNYEGMGQAYKNIGIKLNNIAFNSSGEAVIANGDKYFYQGDEIISNNLHVGWVSVVNGNNITFMNETGQPFLPSTTGNSIRITKSGRRNLIGISMGSITSLQNPLPYLQSNNFGKILNATTQLYKEGWSSFCECFTEPNDLMRTSKNPYAVGMKGNWRSYKSLSYLTGREQAWKNNNTNIRRDGVYTSFNPYWQNDKGKWIEIPLNWTFTTEVTKFSPYGMELENKDALGIYSSAIFGYTKVIPTSVSSNAQYREIAFDGFEDYDYLSCSDDHFSYKSSAPSINSSNSHTGKRSISISSGSSKTITKIINSCSLPE